MRAHPHLYLTCGLRTHPGHPCPPPFPQLTQPRRSAIVSCAPTPTIPRSDHNKDAVIRPGTLRFPYAQTAERAPISCLFLGDTRLGEGRTISLPRSTLTGAAAKLTAPPIPGTARKDRSGPATDVAWRAQGGEGHRAGDTARWWRCRARYPAKPPGHILGGILTLESAPSAGPAVGHPELVADEPPAAALQDRRTPHPACPVLHPTACRKLLDTVSVPADRRTHLAARVASDVIERMAQPRLRASLATRAECPRGGEAAAGSPRDSRTKRRW